MEGIYASEEGKQVVMEKMEDSMRMSNRVRNWGSEDKRGKAEV